MTRRLILAAVAVGMTVTATARTDGDRVQCGSRDVSVTASECAAAD